MKKIIKMLSFLFLLGGLSSLARSQNFQTFASESSKINKEMKNLKALERLQKYNDELNLMVENNIPLYSIKFPRNNDDKNLSMELFIDYSSDVINNDVSINKDNNLKFDLTLFAEKSSKKFITSSDKIYADFYNEKGELIQRVELNNVSKNEDAEQTKNAPTCIRYKNEIKLENLSINSETVYNLKLSDSENKNLGESKFKLKSRFSDVVDSNGNSLDCVTWHCFLPSSDGDYKGVVSLNSRSGKNASFLNESMAGKKIYLNFYDIDGKCFATRNTKVKRISHNDGSADVFLIGIYSNKVEMPLVCRNESFIVEFLDENGNYLASYLVPKDFVKQSNAKLEPPEPVFLIDKQKSISDYCHFLDKNTEKASVASRLMEESTIYESLDYWDATQSKLSDSCKAEPNLYIISKLNDPNSILAKYTGPIYFTFADKKDVVFESEPGEIFKELNMMSHKFNLDKKLIEAIKHSGWGKDENFSLVLYTDKSLNDKIAEFYFNIPKDKKR